MNLCTRFAALLLLLPFWFSCKKDLGPCTGNCELVQFSGIAVNPGTQKPLGGLVVEVNMGRRQNCTFCGPWQVASGKTRGDGTFSFSVKVDTTKVINTYCEILVEGPTNYIVYAQSPPLVSAYDPGTHNIEWPLPLDSTGVAPYEEYDFYQPVLLTVQLHRVTPIPSFEPYFEFDVVLNPGATAPWLMYESPSNADTTITLYTGANVFSKINTIQSITDSTKEYETDSVFCVPGGNNTINISY
jgi:hypothetical protein